MSCASASAGENQSVAEWRLFVGFWRSSGDGVGRVEKVCLLCFRCAPLLHPGDMKLGVRSGPKLALSGSVIYWLSPGIVKPVDFELVRILSIDL
jgi:hypothetical protein